MSSSRRVRPSTAVQTVQSGRFESDSGRVSSEKVRRVLGNCTLSDAQIEQLADGLHALADFAVTAFAEQRKRQNTVVTEQPVPIPELTEPVRAVQ